VPISEATGPIDIAPAVAGNDRAYRESLEAFLRSNGLAGAATDVPGIFHAVRNIPYFSSGERSPEAVLRDNRGACTAKHILLRDLLRHCGEVADVEIVEGDFAAAIPDVASMPDTLRRWVRTAGVRDFHCYVVWRSREGEVKLDATWPDSLARFGFPVNSAWTGEGDTALAIEPAFVKARVEDVIGRKERLLSMLSSSAAEKRRSFLGLLSKWLTEVT
jgi:hypothetical protein